MILLLPGNASVSVRLSGPHSPNLLNFMSIISLCSRKHETSLCRLRCAHNRGCSSLSALASFFFVLCKIVTFLHPVSFLRISSPPFSSPFHRKMDLAVNTCGQTSISVSLCVPAFASFKTANPLSGNLCRSESSRGSFITKYGLAIKGNGAGESQGPRVSLHGCHAESRCH